jgi:hypothetical protein
VYYIEALVFWIIDILGRAGIWIVVHPRVNAAVVIGGLLFLVVLYVRKKHYPGEDDNDVIFGEDYRGEPQTYLPAPNIPNDPPTLAMAYDVDEFNRGLDEELEAAIEPFRQAMDEHFLHTNTRNLL